MLFTSKLSPEQWAEARRMRADGATYTLIGRHFCMQAASIAKRARIESWASPAGDVPRKAARAKPVPAAPRTAGIRTRLAERLYRVIEYRIKLMELRMIRQLQTHLHADGHEADAAPPASTKDERESFAALIDSINKVTEMASESAPAADGRRKAAAGAASPELTALSDDIDPDGLAIASEKDQFRRELAEHLGRMFPKP